MTNGKSRPLVAFCMQWVPSYREAFYEHLEPVLDQRGIDMLVIHGAPPASRRARNDSVEPPWATFVKNKEIAIKGVELTWQPSWRASRHADLVIVQQETGLLFNYLALATRRLRRQSVAMWGHGANSNPADANRAAESIKERVTPFADWFFAYTERSASVVEGLGFERDQITVVNNSRDSDLLATNDDDSVDPEIAALVATVKARSKHVGWMVSALDTWKRLPFLVETLDVIRHLVPDFEFFVLGQGDDLTIQEAAQTRPWLHALGSRFAADKSAVGAIADVTIQPGLIGLHVIDAFAFGTPMVTTEHSVHSHEFDYLVNGENALVLAEGATAAELGSATADLLRDPEKLQQLRAGGAASAASYTIDSMVERFADGIESALRVRS